MELKIKTGTLRIDTISGLLDFMKVRNVEGARKVAGDVQLTATVPLAGVQSDEGIAWTLSTFDIDRCGERIDPQGWDFSRFAENPVVQWAHRYDIPAIGKIEGLTIDDKGLRGVVVFNDKSFDRFGWAIGQRVKAGVIRAGSVGFRVMEIEIPSKDKARDGTRLIFRKQELLEFSICNVPANPFALAKMGDERLLKGEKTGVIASPFWGSIINNSQENIAWTDS